MYRLVPKSTAPTTPPTTPLTKTVSAADLDPSNLTAEHHLKSYRSLAKAGEALCALGPETDARILDKNDRDVTIRALDAAMLADLDG